MADGMPLPEFISVERLLRTLAELAPGVTELGCHPALRVDLDTRYGAERIQEVATLCDPRVRSAVAGQRIELRSFGIGAPRASSGRER